MPTATKEQFERHKTIFLKYAPKGTTIFSLAYKNRDGVIKGARYFVATEVNRIKDVTTYVSTLTDSTWNDKTGVMKTRAIGDAVDLIAIRLFDDLKAYKHERL
jgi:hypothetical protein